MDTQKVTNFVKGVRESASKNSTAILMTIGITGMGTALVLAVKATPKALTLIEARKEELETDELTKVETVKAAWKPYIPAAATFIVSSACLIGANSIHAKRNAALATAYKLSETAFSEYKNKVIENIGEKKEKVVREQVAQAKVDKTPVTKSEVIIAGSGDVLFLEPVSGRYFTSDIEYIRRTINEFNYRMTTGMESYISLSEFYDAINLHHTSTSDDIGWNLYRDGLIDTSFSAAVADDGRPCLVLEYSVSPRYDFMNLM